MRVLSEVQGSMVDQLAGDFAGYGIELAFTDEALREIAEIAVAEQTGARGLLSVLEGVLRDFKFELPSTSIRRLEVGVEMVRDPAQQLAVLLQGEADGGGEAPQPAQKGE